MKVYWLSVLEDVPPHDYWDHGLINWMLAKFECEYDEVNSIPVAVEEAEGAVVVIPARAQKDEVERLNLEINKLSWCVVILTGDEESVFPWRDLKHPNMRVWVMSPKPELHGDTSWLIGSGFRGEEPNILRRIGQRERDYDWFFSGQVTHPDRELMAEQLRGMNRGKLNETDGFGKGLSYEDYVVYMASSKFAPAPGGPVSPDNFRLYEALEAGAVPIADSGSYWPYLLGELPPFPIISSWSRLPGLMPSLLNDWPENANLVYGWWQVYKRKLVDKLEFDITAVSQAPERKLKSDITVIMPTNAVPSHPSTWMIEQTIASVRSRLPEAEIIITFDGPSPEVIERKANYLEYVNKMLWKINNEYQNVIPLVFQQHVHQTGMTREALKLIKTPLILFVEHDTPLDGDIPFTRLEQVVRSGYANTIRLHHEAQVHPEHEYLMLDQEPIDILGVPLIRTVQWSNRPHLTSTQFYREMFDKYVTDKPMFIEHVFYGAVLAGKFDQFRTHIFAPRGTQVRSLHLDGRRAS